MAWFWCFTHGRPEQHRGDDCLHMGDRNAEPFTSADNAARAHGRVVARSRTLPVSNAHLLAIIDELTERAETAEAELEARNV